MEPNAVSFNPTDAVSGGSLLDDSEATLISLRSCLFDYNGNIPAPIVALHAQWQYVQDGQLKVANEYYSAGDTKNLAPSQDGRQLIPIGAQGGLNDSCNAYKLMVSFINGGFNQPIGKDLGIFDGSRCYVKRVPQPKVAGASKDSKPLLVQKYLGLGQVMAMPTAAPQAGPPQMGGGMPAGVGAAPGVGTYPPPYTAPQQFAPTPAPAPQQFQQPIQQQVPAQAPQAPMANPLQEKAVGVMVSLLASKGGSLPKNQMAAAAFGMLATDPDRNSLVQLMFTDGFLGGPGVPWKYDGQTISL